MKIEDVRNLTVVGAGNMGHQIAMLAAISGYSVVCCDQNPEVLEKAGTFKKRYLSDRVAKGRLTQVEAEEAGKRLSFEVQLPAAVRDADYVIEAVVEKLSVKEEVFTLLDHYAPSRAILASNSSAIVSSKFAHATSRPEKVVNLHFFNPALVMKLVEVVKGAHVSDETANLSVDLCRSLGKEPVLLEKEVEGFLLNRILGAIFKEANWLLEMGVASIEDIDKACTLGAGHPMGPFRLNDLTGIDLSYIAMMEAFRVSGDPTDLPPPSLVERYQRGQYGEKTGQGWYLYSE